MCAVPVTFQSLTNLPLSIETMDSKKQGQQVGKDENCDNIGENRKKRKKKKRQFVLKNQGASSVAVGSSQEESSSDNEKCGYSPEIALGDHVSLSGGQKKLESQEEGANAPSTSGSAGLECGEEHVSDASEKNQEVLEEGLADLAIGGDLEHDPRPGIPDRSVDSPSTLSNLLCVQRGNHGTNSDSDNDASGNGARYSLEVADEEASSVFAFPATEEEYRRHSAGSRDGQ